MSVSIFLLVLNNFLNNPITRYFSSLFFYLPTWTHSLGSLPRVFLTLNLSFSPCGSLLGLTTGPWIKRLSEPFSGCLFSCGTSSYGCLWKVQLRASPAFENLARKASDSLPGFDPRSQTQKHLGIFSIIVSDFFDSSNLITGSP
jgi:hypothetical protein